MVDLLDQARLEAGHERRNVEPFDAARLIKEYCESTRSLVADRNLFLKCEGPSELRVEGDSPKVQRILQNLVLNALNVTQSGGIRVTWEAGTTESDDSQWALCVQDTGPGFRTSSTPLKAELKEASVTVRDIEQVASVTEPSSLSADPPATLASEATTRGRVPSGEGIGLSIVKRLCELLDASIELQSAEGQGTTFRVVFPRYYAQTIEGPAS